MKLVFAMLAVTMLAGMAHAQEIPAAQPQASITKTVITPPEGSEVITTTTITPPLSQSMAMPLKDGTKLEVDSDGSVYKVFADGSRVTAPDGIQQIGGGNYITVKNGKRIP